MNAVCTYNVETGKAEEHRIPFDLDLDHPAFGLSENQLLLYSEERELYVLNTDSWERFLLSDEFVPGGLYEKVSAFSPKENMYVVYVSGGHGLNVFSSEGDSYTIERTAGVFCAECIGNYLYVVFTDGFLGFYDMSDGKLVDSMLLDADFSENGDRLAKFQPVSENELVFSSSYGVYVVDLNYLTVRTEVGAGIGYDSVNDGFYLSPVDDILGLKSSGWVKRYSASEVIQKAKQQVSGA